MEKLELNDSKGLRVADEAGFRKKLKSYLSARDLKRLHALYEKNWVKLITSMDKEKGNKELFKLFQKREMLLTKVEATVRTKLKMVSEFDKENRKNYKALEPALKRPQTPLTILDLLTIKHLTKGCKFDIMHSVDDND